MEVEHEVVEDHSLEEETEDGAPPSPHVMGLMLQPESDGQVMTISPEMAVMEVGEESLHGQDEEADDAQQQQDLLASNGQMTTAQLVTLADGQQVQAVSVTLPDDAKMYEGQTIQLEDGTTAIVQNVMPEEPEEQPQVIHNQLPKLVEGQAIQLEDGTIAYIQNTNKDGLQAVQLEDGTTAYITCAGAESLFTDGAQLEATQLTLEQLNQQALAGAPNSQVRLGSERAMSMSEKAFRCQYEGCGRLYTTQHHLKVHERSHTGDRPFKCTQPGCRKAFATGYGLKSHVRVHTGEKPYRCPEEVCDKAFKTSGDLQKHVRTHTGERPFKCPFEGCERSFTTSNIRKVHIRTHTGERPYICDEDGCNKAFSSATNYKNHIRIHTGEKPYVCTVEDCGKRFTEYSSLYKHHVVHTHSKPYMCNHCGKNYRQTSTLSMHKRTAHGDDSVLDPETALLLPPSMNQHNDISTLHPPLPITGSPGFKRVNVQLPGGLVGGLPAPAGEGAMEEDEGALVINTSDAPQVTMMTDNTVIGGFSQEAAQATLQQLTSGQGITLADGDGQQHIYVVTDPAQLEALQQLAQQQLFAHSTEEGAVIAAAEASSE